jgi:hypothetical protein
VVKRLLYWLLIIVICACILGFAVIAWIRVIHVLSR